MHITVFLPCFSLNAKSGILVGYYSPIQSCYYVLSVKALDKYHAVLTQRNYLIQSHDEKCEILGLWLAPDQNSKLIVAAASILFQKNWIILRKSNYDLSLIYVQPKKEIEVFETQTGVVILYEIKCVLQGRGLLPKFQQYSQSLFSSKSVVSKIQFPTTNINDSQHNRNFFAQVIDAEMVVSLYIRVLKFYSYSPTATANNIFPGIYLLICCLYSILMKFFKFKLLWIFVTKFFKVLKHYLFDNLVQVSSVGAHFSLKLKLLSSLCNSDLTKKQDIASALVFDCILGVSFCFWILNYSRIWFYASEILMPSVDMIAKNVEVLIRWLMGIPIGMKLNSPLNEFLGKFFLHHVRLWLEYIQMILMAFVPKNELLFWPFYVTCLGFSFFIAMLSDVVSLLTFHVYCFYVYATRLYGLQIAGVMSFWRLFRGKKWNPLRSRVDTLPHSPDVANHRFLTGTLLFTIFLFLLPTTALYYAIFAFLRLATLCIQKPLHLLSSCVACFPWFSLARRCIRPNAFVTHARFDVADYIGCKGAGLTPAALDEISLPIKLRKANVQDMTVLALLLDAQSYYEVICTGLKKCLDRPLWISCDIKHFSISLLSGKLIKWS